MTVLLVMTNNSVLMQHNIWLVQLPFYNITPNISVCNNYISPYFFATCIQYNFANRVNLSSACVQIQFNSEPLLCLPIFKEKEWNAISVKMQYFNSFANSLLFFIYYKGRLVKISTSIAFLFYKEIYLKYLILYYNTVYSENKFIFT